MSEKDQLKLKIKKVTDFFYTHRNEVILLLVIKMKSSTNNTFNCYDYETEFFSEEELNDFIEVLEEIGIYRDISYGEEEFLSKINSGYFEELNYKYKIVYNTTGSKRIRSRSALIPSICELYNILYASSDILTVSILENKIHTFSLLDYYNFKVPKFWVYHNIYGWVHSNKPPQNIMLIAKPANECASIGITEKSVSLFTKEYEENIIELSKFLNQPVIVQEFIHGWEVEVPVFDFEYPVALSAVGIEMDNNKFLNDKFLAYESVYLDKYSFYNYNKENQSVAKKLMKIACDSYKSMDLRGSVRVDFRITKKGEAYITDYNNSPHLTKFHSCAKAIEYFGLDYMDMFCLVFYKALKKQLYI